MARALGMWWRATLVLLLLLAGMGWAGRAQPAPVGAATCVVTSALDDGGAGTLRAKVADAGCDTITFGAGLGTVNVSSGHIPIARDVIIQGPGRDLLTLDGGLAVRLFKITSGTVTIERLTLARGKAVGNYGGCLWSDLGVLTLRDVRVRDCQASNGGGGLVLTGGATTIERAELRGNVAGFEATLGGGGGAIFIDQYNGPTSLTIRDSIIAGNTATGDSDGGGIRAYRLPDRPNTTSPYPLTLTIERSTVSGNIAEDAGGGLYTSGTTTLVNSTVSDNIAELSDGGGIRNSGTTTLVNSTISGNAAGAGGGGLYTVSAVVLRFVTVVGNTATNGYGGIERITSGTVAVRSSVVAGNRLDGGAASDCSPSIASEGRNLWGTQSPCPNNSGLGDRNLPALNIALAAVLTPTLANNGGPTQTHALVPGSPAIDGGDNTTCAAAPPNGPGGADQRGVARPQGAACDIGAVEHVANVALAVQPVGAGTVARTPQGTGAGPFAYTLGTVVTLPPQPAANQTFVGWTVDGVPQGWPTPLTITMNAAHTVVATFKPTLAFPDVGSGRADFAAIIALASRGTIKGYQDGRYGPDDRVRRDQMAALIARAMPAGPGGPPQTLTPPACLVAGSWDCEVWGNTFKDRAGIDANLWRNAGTMQHYGVSIGYSGAICAAKRVPSPCFGPGDNVTYAQTISFITRAMKAKGYWADQPGAALPYSNVPTAHQTDVRTFHFYTNGLGGVPSAPTTTAGWEAGATRGWFARALWAALDSYWKVDRVP